MRVPLILASGLLLACGCAGTLSKRAGAAAKDWSKMIRGNQILPVYPLTEDLVPGDVFLVDLPVTEQAKAYERDGYLALDQHLVRLPLALDPEAPMRMAAFPSYNFTVERGGGAEVGLPISGVPVAVGLMGAERAVASVTINDATTRGVGTMELWSEVRGWAEEPLVRARLAQIFEQNVGDDAGPPRMFLRVVSRVFLTGGVHVTVNRSDAGAADVGAGAPKEVEVPGSFDEARALSYSRELETLSLGLTEALPGGRMRLGYASASSVSMQEEFEHPLVIGYLGFDLPVYRDGRLGAPVATTSVLLRRAAPRATLGAPSSDQYAYDLRHSLLAAWLAGADVDFGPADARAVVLAAASTLGFEPLPDGEDADVVDAFWDAADRYVASEGDAGVRYTEVVDAVDAAVEAQRSDG